MELEPWNDPAARQWLTTLKSWPKMAKMIQSTLRQDPQKYPHQIRAAASAIIMFAREGLWPQSSGVLAVEDVAALARRQLSQIRSVFSVQTRVNRDLLKDHQFKQLLKSLDQELRLLESRGSSEHHDVPQETSRFMGEILVRIQIGFLF